MAPDITVARHMVRAESVKQYFPCDPRGLGLCGDLLPVFPTHGRDEIARGRKIVCGFTCLHRVGKAAATDFFVAPDFHEGEDWGDDPFLGFDPSFAPETLWSDVFVPRAGAGTVARDSAPTPIEWAAVRQFDLLQEADNLAIYDLEVDEFRRAYRYLMYMRAGGYRLTVVTLGVYEDQDAAAPSSGVRFLRDEQDALDDKLNEEIARLIHVLYLAKPSVLMTGGAQQSLRAGTWRIEDALPHVAMVFGERDMFSHKKRASMRLQEALTDQILASLAGLSQDRVAHDVAVGLTFPDFSKEKNWTYICKGEEQARLFQMAITSVFAPADWISVAGLQSGHALGRDETAVMRHMRGYGLHMEAGAHDFHREMARQSPRFAPDCRVGDLRL